MLLESSTSVCSVALASDGRILAFREVNAPNCHAEKLTVFMEEVMQEAAVAFADLDAVAVSSGPGSYTGLRIGVSAAKGICYAMNKPLIAIGTLDAMAQGMKKEASEGDLLVPMIDARRMEVYCATYDHNGNRLTAVAPVVLDEVSPVTVFHLPHAALRFGGDGMPKAKALLSSLAGAAFSENGLPSAKNMMALAEEKFRHQAFEDVAYFEPFYLKTFHPGPQRSKNS